MFEDRSYKRTFYSAPQSVTSLVAAFLEPTLTVLVFLLATVGFDEPVLRSDLTLCLLVFALTFPGRNRFKDKLLNAGTDIFTLMGLRCWRSWRLCGYATNSLHFFEQRGAAHLGRRHAAAAVAGDGHRPRRSCAGAPHGPNCAIRRSSSVPARWASRWRARCRKIARRVATSSAGSTTAPISALDAETAGKMLGTLQDVAPYVRAHGIKEVYITLPLGSQPRILELLESVQGTTASIFFVPDVFGISIIQGRLQDMNGVPVVGICETPFTGTNELVKRTSDIVLATIILVLISPLLLAIAIGVKLSSPGPVIFRQRRNGLDGGEITVYKFRSMTTQDNGPVVEQATKDDPRITPFGAFLRRTSLDELPQFFNVLQGRMSIVGPRPHAVAHNEHLPRADQGLHGAPQGQARHHRLGAGQRAAWRNRDDRQDEGPCRIRSRISAQLVARPGPADHRAYRESGVLRPQRVLSNLPPGD